MIGAGRWQVARTEWQAACTVKTVGNRSAMTVCKGGGDQCDALRQAVGQESAGNGDGRKVGQVDEVGIGPDPGIEGDRIGLDLVDAVDRSGGWNDKDVDLVPDLRNQPLQDVQPLLRGEDLGSGNVP